MNTTQLNIDNLTHLWTVAGQDFTKGSAYSFSKIKNAQWPNRIWANGPITLDIIEKIGMRMTTETDLIFSVFSEKQETNHLINQDVFILKSAQYGMSLALTHGYKTHRKIEFKHVMDAAGAELWSDTFFQAFRYQITAETVLKTSKDIPYFLVYHQGNLVGTVILFVTNHVMGIHSLGIVPSQRKKGFATDIMHHVLNRAIDQNLSLATLQASEMAKDMYLKMGFTTDFLMKNYTLKK